MAKMQIQNRTQNPYELPLAPGEVQTRDNRMIRPGASGWIDADLHAGLLKGSPAYRAMVGKDQLRVSPLKIEEIEEGEPLQNTSDATPPPELSEAPEARGAEGPITPVVNKGPVEMIEVPQQETPTSKPPRARPSRAKPKPTQA